MKCRHVLHYLAAEEEYSLSLHLVYYSQVFRILLYFSKLEKQCVVSLKILLNFLQEFLLL